MQYFLKIYYKYHLIITILFNKFIFLMLLTISKINANVDNNDPVKTQFLHHPYIEDFQQMQGFLEKDLL